MAVNVAVPVDVKVGVPVEVGESVAVKVGVAVACKPLARTMALKRSAAGIFKTTLTTPNRVQSNKPGHGRINGRHTTNK